MAKKRSIKDIPWGCEIEPKSRNLRKLRRMKCFVGKHNYYVSFGKYQTCIRCGKQKYF